MFNQSKAMDMSYYDTWVIGVRLDPKYMWENPHDSLEMHEDY